MLNTFPTLLAFGMFAPLFLRLALGLTFFFIGLSSVTQRKESYVKRFQRQKFPFPKVCLWTLGVIEIIVGIFITIGLYTQISALVALYVSFNLLILERGENRVLPHTPLLYVILGVISFSLLFSGAGFLAFDFPL